MKTSKRILLVFPAIAAVLAIVVIRREDHLRREGPKSDAAFESVSQHLRKALVSYRIQMGDYPSTEEGLSSLTRAPEKRKDRWNGPYFDGAMTDPWGNPFQYRYPGSKNPTSYDLWSFGPDRVASGDDIGNWPK